MKLNHRYKGVDQTNFKPFNTTVKLITIIYRSTLNYLINRSTNVSAESFNG